ncbi:hypothetical protein SLE2022_258210 [Rubroshorea leprosula]
MEEEKKEEQGLKLKGRKKSSKEKRMEEMLLKFSSGSQNQAARESVTDSGIENRNGSLQRATDLKITERIWTFAKETEWVTVVMK